MREKKRRSKLSAVPKKSTRPFKERPSQLFPQSRPFLNASKFDIGCEPSLEGLRDQSAILQSLFDNMGDGVIVVDTQGHMIVYNRALEQMLGLGSMDIPSAEWAKKYGLYLPDQKTRYASEKLPLVRALKGEVLESVEIFIKNAKRPKGLWITVNAQPIRSADGVIFGAIAVCRDITDQKKYATGYWQTEKALEDSEVRFKSLVSNIPGAIYRCANDSEWTMEYLSDAIQEITGYPATDFIQNRARSFASIIIKSDAGKVEEGVQKAIRRRRSYTLEYRIVHKDGQVRWVYERGRAVYALNGEVLWLDGAIFDVTDQKEFEQKLHQSSRYLEKIINSVADPIFVKDRQHRWVLLNDACCRFMGYAREKLIGKSDYEFFPKKEADIFWEKDEEVFNSGKENLNEESFTDSKGIQHVIVTKKALYEDSLGESYIVGVIRDITEQKFALKRLAAQYAVTKVLAESGSLEEASPKILQALCETLDWDFGVIWKVDTLGQVLQPVEIGRGQGVEMPVFEKKVRHMNFSPGIGLPGRVWKTGQITWIKDVMKDNNFPRMEAAREEGLHAACGFPLRFDGQVAGVLELFTREIREPDVEILKALEAIGTHIGQFFERKQVQDSLVQKNIELARLTAEREYLELFAYVASHDLQEPLQKVIAFAGLLKSYTQELDEKSRSCVDRMEQSSLRMSRMIEDLLRFTKVTTGSDLFEPVDLRAVIEEVISELDFKISKSGAEMSVGDFPSFRADRRQIFQLFLNLIANALKFQKTGDKPRVTIEGRPSSPGFLQIAVTDNGIGFNEKYLEKIFRPFERLHTNSVYEGSGMGLAICKKIVARHGGTLTASSQEGKGTTFYVTLPLDPKIKVYHEITR